MAIYYLIAILVGALVGTVLFSVLCMILLNRAIKRANHLSELNYDLARLCDKLDLKLNAMEDNK